MHPVEPPNELNRREFLRGGSFAAVLSALGAVELRAQDAKEGQPAAPSKTVGPPVKFGLIGCGVWGREVLDMLTRLPNAPVVALCDTYGAFLRRAARSAPDAKQYENYQELLADKNVQAVVIATPTHQHKEIVLEAIKAGKHIYCEAPLAHTVEEAQAIVKAAKAAVKINFQPGLQNRADPQRHFLLEFVRTGALGKFAMARAQWHKKESWRRVAPTNEREKEINWRLSPSVSTGLAGENGVHQIDAITWFLSGRPKAVQGFGSTILWTDGREKKDKEGRYVPDTVQAILEYDNGVRTFYDGLLTNSYERDHELFYGTDAALLVRDGHAWLFKEADSPLLGWEVYAKKDSFYKETGIALVANATKLTTVTAKEGEDVNPINTALEASLKAFVHNSHTHQAGVEDFVSNFGDDPDGLKQYLGSIKGSLLPAPNAMDGLEATVIALKTNEAIVKGQRIEFEKAWFEA